MKKNLMLCLALLLSFTTTNLSAQYCTTGGPSSMADSNVDSVGLTGDAGSFIDFKGCPGVAGVEDLTATQTVNVTAGSAYTADILFGTCGSPYLGAGEAWIDWNQNDVFEASESIGTWTGTPPATNTAMGFTVPVGAFNGTTRMRVMQQEGGGVALPLNPCGSYSWGSVTDFTVVVSGGITLSCAAPNLLTATGITATTADLGWTENGTATSWQIEWGPTGFTQGAGTYALASTNPHNLTGLAPTTSYDFYVRAICAVGDTSGWSTLHNFTTIASCPAATVLTATSITTTTADLGWTENGSATSWQIEWGAAGFTQGAGTYALATANPENITGLTANTSYDFYVRAICGVGDTSLWSTSLNFMTPCNTYTLPWTEDFENAGTIPACWSMAGGENWRFSNIATGNHIGNNGILSGTTSSNSYFGWVDASGSDAPATLTSPYIDISSLTVPQLSFYEISNNEGFANSTLDVEVWDGAAWNAVGTYNTNTVGWEKKEIVLSGLTFTGPAAVRFTFSETVPGDFYDDIAIDDVTFEEVPNCPAPSVLTATSVTTTTADLGWTENGTATSWMIEWGPAGFTPGSGTSVATSTNPENVAGLTANTSYDFYVSAFCGVGDTSSWSSAFNFTTSCGVIVGDTPNDAYLVTSLPYTTTGNTSTCYTNTVGNANADVWYQYIVAPCTDSLTISLCGSAFDTYLRVYSADTITEIFFNDDDNITCGPGNNSNLVIDVTASAAIAPGDTIYILVEGYGANTGAFNLDITDVVNCPPPAPIDVSAAAFLNLNATYCNAGTITASVIITNMTTNTETNVPYSITANGTPVGGGVIATLAANASDTITLGPLPAATGIATIMAWTALPGDVNLTNDTISMMVSVSNTLASASVTAPILCQSDSGEVRALGANGLAATVYNYQWDAATGNAMTSVVPNLPAGSYAVTVTDDIGCADSTMVMLTEPTAISTMDSVMNVMCNGDSTGTSTIMATGGTGAYTFMWNTGGMTAAAMNLGAGTYQVTVTDANGCMAMLSSTITEPTALVAAIVDNADGTATASGSGGTGAYTFMWDATAANQTDAMATGLSNGTYSVTVTDANGCMNTTSVTITGLAFAQLTNLSNLNMFPNPTSGNVFVELDLVNNADVKINITNAIGQLVASRVLNNVQSEKVELETSNLPSGIYMVQFTIGQEQLTRKLIVSKQ